MTAARKDLLAQTLKGFNHWFHGNLRGTPDFPKKDYPTSTPL